MRGVVILLGAALLASACAAGTVDPIATGAPQEPAVPTVMVEVDQPTTDKQPQDTLDEESGDSDAADALASRIAEAATFETLQETDCFGYPAVLGARFRCSTFYVPAKASAPESRLLGLEVVRIGRIGTQSIGRAENAPLVFVQGGPGAPALDLVSPLWEDFFEPLSEARGVIEAWCQEHIGQVLPITNVKDTRMVELWDDRAVQVTPNTGEPVGRSFNGFC